MIDLRDASLDFGEGYRAALEHAAAELRRIAEDLCSRPAPPYHAASHYDLAADTVERMTPRPEPTGLHYRGG